MIAIAKPATQKPTGDGNSTAGSCHAQFLSLLPAIRRHARIAFRFLDAEAREDAIQGTIAHAYAAFDALVKRNRAELAYARPLARYAVARVLADRHVGTSVNAQDISSGWCQRQKGLNAISLDQWGAGKHGWRDIVVEDRRATPADTAAMRIDFAAWLGSLPNKHRQIAELLATGEPTKQVASRFRITAGRVSQIRRLLHRSWCFLQSDSE
jgi:hypothetical protein